MEAPRQMRDAECTAAESERGTLSCLIPEQLFLDLLRRQRPSQCSSRQIGPGQPVYGAILRWRILLRAERPSLQPTSLQDP